MDMLHEVDRLTAENARLTERLQRRDEHIDALKAEVERLILKGMVAAPGAIVVVPEEEGGFSAEIPSLPGCMTCAETWEEVWTMIQDAKSCWLQAAFPARRSPPGDGKIEK